MQWNHVLVAADLVLSVVWNTASPIRAWLYGRYGFSVSEITVSKALRWDSELDLDAAVLLYKSAGIDIAANLPTNGSVRILDMVLDFGVYKKSTHWAHLVNENENDPLVGRMCRTSMAYRPTALDEAMSIINGSQDVYWGDQMFEYVEEQETCFVGEVTEAIICIKGYNASDLLNLNWATPLNPADPDVDAALQRYQKILMPDLNKCLARRSMLICAQPSFENAMHVLLDEIARNYSLLPHNRAGEKNLMQPVTVETGFVDVSGVMSGRRVVQLVGHAPSFGRDAGPDSIGSAREIFWACVDSPPQGMTFYDCLGWNTLAYPGMTTAYFMDEFFVEIDESIRYRKTRMFNNIQGYTYINEQPVNDPVEYLSTSDIVPPSLYKGLTVNVAYRDFVDRAVFEDQYGKDRIDAVWSRGSEMMTVRCMVQHGCFDSCPLGANGLDYYFTYNALVGGKCTVHKLQLPADIRAFVSKKCLGIGTGNSSLVYITYDSNLVNVTGSGKIIINNTASPFEILACMLGGRVPGIRQNAVLSDDLAPTVETVPNLMLAQTFTRGSEQLFINFFSIMSLVGSTIFAFAVARQTLRSIAILQSCPPSVAIQVRFSVCESDVAVGVWRRHHGFLRAFAFASLMCWYIGAVNSRCSWFVDGQDLWDLNANAKDKTNVLNSTSSPTYLCLSGDVMGMFRDRSELIRLIGASYTSFALIFLGPKIGPGAGACLRGATQHPHSFAVTALMCGLVPVLLISWAVTGFNTWRINTHRLNSIHNQLFVMALWVVAIMLFNGFRNQWCDRIVSPLLALIGFRQQRVLPLVLLNDLLCSDHYYISHKHHRHQKVSTVPLSVLLECPLFNIDKGVSLPSNNYKYSYDAKSIHIRPATSDKSVQPASSTHGPAQNFIDEFLVEFA